MHTITKTYENILRLCHKIKSINFNNQHIKYNGISFTTYALLEQTKHKYIQTITSAIVIY